MSGKFVESATLKVIDQSSKRINTIEKAMRSFRAEANRLKKLANVAINPKINTGKITQAKKAVDSLNSSLNRMKPVKSSTAGINTTIRALQRLQRQVQQMNGRGVNVPITGGSGGGRGFGRGGSFGGGFGGGGYSFNTSVLDIWAAGFIYRLGATIESSIIRGFRDGVARVDNAKTYGRVLNFTPEERALIETQSQRISAQNPRLANSQVAGLYNELSPIMGGDPGQATQLVEMAANFINLRLAMGKTMDEATSGMRDIFKFLDNINRLQGPDGGIDPKALDYFDVILKMTAASGADITPQIMNTVGKFSRSFGKTMSPEGMAVLLAQAESMGRVAGSSMNRVVEQLNGSATKAAMAAQAEWGLITTKEVVEGSTGGKTRKTRVFDSVVDQELLREDPNLWFIKNVIPKLQERGVDLNNPAQVANALGPLFSNVVGKDMALNLATWQGEWQQVQAIMAKVQTDNAALNKILDESTVNTLRSVGNQATEVLGEIGDSLATKLLPGANMVRDVLNSLAGYVGAEEGGAGRSAGVLAGLGIGGGLLGLGAMKGLGWLTGGGALSVSVGLNTSATDRNTLALGVLAGKFGGVDIPGSGPKKKTNDPLIAPSRVMNLAVLAASAVGAKEVYDRMNDSSNSPYERGLSWLPDPLDVGKWLGDWLTKNAPNSSIPTLPEGTQTTKWEDALNKFLFGAAADPNFNSKDHFGIQTSVETGSVKMLETFTEGSEIVRGKISESGNELGSNIATTLLGIAGQMGASIGSAMQANFNPAALQVTIPSAGPDTGVNPNGMR